VQPCPPFDIDQTESPNVTTIRTDAAAMKIHKATVREPLAVYLRSMSGGDNTLRVSIRQRALGEAKAGIAALFGGIMRLKHIYVFDEDIDIHDDLQVESVLGPRFQAYHGTMGLPGLRA